VIQITAVRLDGGDGHEHITHVMWSSRATAAALATAGAIVDWLVTDGSNLAFVRDGRREVPVEVVRPDSEEAAYLRSRYEGAWTDHLLALPRF
jgi:hypothetical protein